jgi:hypothetical protein
MRTLPLAIYGSATILSALLSACAASPPGSSAYDPAAELDRKGREMGFHIVMHNGEKAYCHNTAPTASHISQLDCLDSNSMKQLAENAEKSQDELARRQQQTFVAPRPIS